MRRLIHRDSAPVLSFSAFGAKKKEEKEKNQRERNRRASDTPNPRLLREPLPDVPVPKYYVKRINRDKAEEILNSQPIGTFLIRDRESATSSGCYTLSLKHKVGLKHHKIETHSKSNKLVIAGHEKLQFDTLDQLTEFFIKSQKKDLQLIPYDPDTASNRMSRMSLEQPSYEDMDAPAGNADSEMYLSMDEGRLDLEQHPGNMSSRRNGSDTTPPVPNRKDYGQQSYENLSSPPTGHHKRQTQQRFTGYENMPEKGAPPSPNAPPRIPPRAPLHSGQPYENMPGKAKAFQQPANYENTPPRLPGQHSYQNVPERPSQSPPILTRNLSYQNVPDRSSQVPAVPERNPSQGQGYENYSNTATGYENHFTKGSQHGSFPGPGSSRSHGYQNLPPKVAPRRSPNINYSAEQSLPERKQLPLRRVKTDTERDYASRHT